MKIREGFYLPRRPENLGTVYSLVCSQPEVNAQIILRKIIPAATDFIRLEISGNGLDTRV